MVEVVSPNIYELAPPKGRLAGWYHSGLGEQLEDHGEKNQGVPKLKFNPELENHEPH